MTTADVENLMVNLEKACNPGLLYGFPPKDYIPYLRGLNYSDEQMSKFLQESTKGTTRSISHAQLNYASFVIQAGEKVQKYTRTVRNVGDPRSVYKVEVDTPDTLKVTVKPAKLRFTKVDQKLTYEVTFDMTKVPRNSFIQGYITWKSESQSISVRSQVMAICT